MRLLFLLIPFFMVSAQETNVWKSTEGNYQVRYPNTWEAQTGAMGMDVVLQPTKEHADPSFRENVNILSLPLKEPLSLDVFYQASVEKLQKQMDNFRLLETQEITVGGQPAKLLIYKAQMGEFKAQIVQVLFAKPDRAFIITGAATEDHFAQFRPLFTGILGSFQFL